MLQLLLCQLERTNPMLRDATYLRGLVTLYEAALEDLAFDGFQDNFLLDFIPSSYFVNLMRDLESCSFSCLRVFISTFCLSLLLFKDLTLLSNPNTFVRFSLSSLL